MLMSLPAGIAVIVCSALAVVTSGRPLSDLYGSNSRFVVRVKHDAGDCTDALHTTSKVWNARWSFAYNICDSIFMMLYDMNATYLVGTPLMYQRTRLTRSRLQAHHIIILAIILPIASSGRGQMVYAPIYFLGEVSALPPLR